MHTRVLTALLKLRIEPTQHAQHEQAHAKKSSRASPADAAPSVLAPSLALAPAPAPAPGLAKSEGHRKARGSGPAKGKVIFAGDGPGDPRAGVGKDADADAENVVRKEEGAGEVETGRRENKKTGGAGGIPWPWPLFGPAE